MSIFFDLHKKHRLSMLKTKFCALVLAAKTKLCSIIICSFIIYKDKHNAPVPHFTEANYTFHTPEDTGTGIAFKGLVVFDLAMMHLAKLPILVHDSLILKQISDDTIENILAQYSLQHGLEQIIGFLLGIGRSVFADVYAEKVDKASKLQQSFFHG